jgi:hypothetical protein
VILFLKRKRNLQSNGGPILKGGQKKDVDGDGKITGKDFAMLKTKGGFMILLK